MKMIYNKIKALVVLSTLCLYGLTDIGAMEDENREEERAVQDRYFANTYDALLRALEPPQATRAQRMEALLYYAARAYNNADNIHEAAPAAPQ
jgi:hypothetical protein